MRLKRKEFRPVAFAAIACLTVAPAFGATSVSQFGITWTFSADRQTGQYANGDYWVVGPVDIISITNNFHTNGLLPSAGLDGSMINPGTDTKQGYDNRLGSYQAPLNTALINGAPVSSTNVLTLPVNSSLISSVSWIVGEPGCPDINAGTGEPRPVLRSAAILTCVSNAPPAGTFRPPYCGSDKSPRFNKSQLDYSKLSNLTPVAYTPTLTNMEARFAGPWIDHVNEYLGAMVHPSMHMPQYGEDMSVLIGQGALMLQLDFAQLPGSPSKETLLVRFTQLGIDLAGIADDGGGWPSNGGHQMGRKFPILLAGVVLNDAHMKDVGNWSTDFQEDLDTFYVAQTNVSITHSAKWAPDSRAIPLSYEVENIGIPEWGIRHTANPYTDNMHWTTTYRWINNRAYAGWVLTTLIMGQREAWNHEPLFDYIDRAIAIGKPGDPPGSSNYGYYVFGNDFIRVAWQTYRGNYWPQWIPENPTNFYGQGHLYYSLAIATDSLLPTGKVGAAYSQLLTAGGGVAPYTWALLSGSLPSGLALTGGGSITGTPVTAATANFSIKVTDNSGVSATNTFSLTVGADQQISVTTTNIIADTADRCIGVNTNGTPVIGQNSLTTHNIADDNAASSKANQCAVIMFKLPVLKAGETISTANLALGINVSNINLGTDPLPKGVDIYGLRYATNTTVLTSDYGFKTIIGANDTLIQDNIVQFTSNSYAYAVYNTDTAGDAALAAWLNARYTAGAVGGDYVFLRIHADSQSASAIYVTSANSTNNTLPALTLGIASPVPGGTDDDSDGIPNDWESRHFGGSTNAHPNAMAANGINTIYETYVAGLDPTNPVSVFLISDIRPLTAGNILQWNAASGRVYSIYRSTNLLNGFQPLETNIVWPQNSWTGQMDQSGVFYKLQVDLHP